MNIILIILTSTLMGALFVGFTAIGFYAGIKYSEKKKDVLEITDKNIDAYMAFMHWFNYAGGIKHED